MKKTLLILAVFVGFAGWAQEKIQWMSIEKAYELTQSEENPKKIFIDVYTDWCGWCKRMDKATFQKPEVAAYMNEHYYNVKFNAEQKEDITILNNTFTFVAQPRARTCFLFSCPYQPRWAFHPSWRRRPRPQASR